MSKAEKTTAELGGIDESKLDAEAIANALEKVGIAPYARATLAVRATLLRKHFEEARGKGEKLLECDNCGGDSTRDFDACPFCGIGEDADDSVANEDAPPPEYAEVGPEVELDVENAEPQGGFEFDPAPAVAELEPVKAEPAKLKSVPPPSPVDGQALAPLRKPRRGAKATDIVETVHVNGKAIEGVLVEAAATPIDKFVAEIKYLRRATEVGGYMLAKRLAEGEISGVWKTRLNEKQKPVYGNFETFAQIELEMSARYVREQLQLYNRFTEEQFKALKPSKLRLVLQVSPDAQPKVLEEIKGGASRRQIEREYLGRKNADTVGAKNRAKSEAPKPSTSGKVTLAMVEGKSKFDFFAKPEKKGDEPKPAKRIGQMPWARLPLPLNDVEALITLTLNKRGEFVGVLEIRRVDPTK